jgi:predicted metal-dependent hydrolase
MDRVRVGPYEIAYRLQPRSRRNSIGIRVLSQAEVVVYAPQSIDEARIRDIVKRKVPWIIRRFESIAAARKAFPDREFVSGEQVLYLGRTFRLVVRKTNRVIRDRPSLDGKRLVITIEPDLDEMDRKEAVVRRLRSLKLSFP